MESRRLPIRPGHALYPVLATIALVGLAFGGARREGADGMPEEKTHPYFPDQVWPYPILAMAVLVTLGLLAVAGQPVLKLGPPADPRAVAIARPEWYFIALFQFVKLGPALLTSILVPLALVLGLIFWPLLDARAGPTLARRFGWRSWPAPKRNSMTGTLWMAAIAIVTVLTLWVMLWPQLCVPWFYNGPVCGA